MANKKYKMIPVDQETYDKLARLCDEYHRKQGAQVSHMVNVEWEKLGLMKFVLVDEAPLSSVTTSPQMPEDRRNLGGGKMNKKARA